MTQILLSTSSRSGLLKLLFTLSAVSIIVGVTTVNGAPQGDDRVIQQAQDAVREKIWREQVGRRSSSAPLVKEGAVAIPAAITVQCPGGPSAPFVVTPMLGRRK